MNEKEESIKRSIEETSDDNNHKKQKLNNEDTAAIESKETEETVISPSVPNKELDNNSTLVEEVTKNMEQQEKKMVSADPRKAVTALPVAIPIATSEPEKQQQQQQEEITSEQLLFALTSVPAEAGSSTQPTVQNNDKKQPPNIPPIVMPTETNNIKPVTTVTSANTTNTPTPTPNPATTTTSTTSSLVTGLGIPPKLPTLSPPSKTNTNLSLPDISAALRRLSSASVMDHFSPSSTERKGSLEPSEILGNALAAVAATTPSVQATIGNLAANISTLIHSGLEEQRRRRKSSIAANVLLSNMMADLISSRPRPKLVVKNEQVWKMLEGIEEKALGVRLYTPSLTLPSLEDSVNGLMEIRVPARYLTFDNIQVRKRALWGTDVYTDDSDVVAMTIHSGQYKPAWVEPEEGTFMSAVLGVENAVEKQRRRHRYAIPDHDLKVIVRVLPTLEQYAGTIRNKLKSREWGKHDGMSLFIQKVEKIKRGDAKLKGRSTLKSSMFAYESYRKHALELNHEAKKEDNDSITVTTRGTPGRGRIKKTSRVIRMFKIHSELKNNK
ncbi:MAG: histone deacetylation protein Rxt3-domain-containing protein [Benjaminiella poitrasii]|nr:MAG: histone deacetylation protein Rxt3-domain-containing protein [Benjaminiella poitrasii]